jgi:predicted Zn-ribbon and HTH transcriptional regulator
MGRIFSMLNRWKEEEIKMNVRGSKNTEEAVLKAIEAHNTPLTFNDILELMPEKFNHRERVRRALKKLAKKRKVMQVVVVTVDKIVKAWAKMTDTPILVSIPVKFLEEEGYETLIGFGYYDQKKPYGLYSVKADCILIHINPSKSPDMSR